MSLVLDLLMLKPSGYVTTSTKPGTGWRMNGTKYVVLRELEGPVLYLKRVRERARERTGCVVYDRSSA